MEIQNNLNKSIELSNKFKCITIGERCKNIEDACLEMAQWKEQQMIDKAVEWLKNNIYDYYRTDEFEQWFDEMFEDFKQAMKEE